MLACTVFEEEIRSLARQTPEFVAVEYLPMGLHDQPTLLNHRLQEAIDKLAQRPDLETIVLAYALCGNGVIGLRSHRCRLILPRSDDCIGIFMGGAQKRSQFLRQNPRSYFYSPGWIREKRVPGPDRANWIRAQYAHKYDEETIDDLVEADADCFKPYNCATYLAMTDNLEAREYCRNCARHLGWEFREMKADSAFLQKLLAGPWEDDARFLVLAPGQAVAHDPRTVFKAVPV